MDEQSPQDVAYVHSVYAPISIRLVEQFAARPGGWRAIRDVLDLLPGPTIEESQPRPNNKAVKLNNQQDQQRRVLVLFVGGCTFAEISALRFLSEQEDSPVEFSVATTSVINGNSFIKSVMSDVKDNMAR